MDEKIENNADRLADNNRLRKICHSIFNRNVVKAIALGQLLSILICGTAVTSGLLHQRGISIPTAQSFLNYALLCMVYTTWLACRRAPAVGIVEVLKVRGWKYFLLALIDVEANYLMVKAYQYTTVTSVQLLDCLTIPTVLVLSWLFLRVRYQKLHVLGVIICLLGAAALVVADVLLGKDITGGGNKALGDVLCVAGAVLYGVSNVGQEYVLHSFDRVEFLGMIGMFGTMINALQFVILERQEIASIQFGSYQIVLLLLGFSACLFLLYSLMPVVIGATSAASVNLNLLSADFYALLFGLFLFHYQFHFLYFGSFVLILVGVVVYSLKPTPTVQESHLDNGEQDPEIAPGNAQASAAEETDSLLNSPAARPTTDTHNITELGKDASSVVIKCSPKS